MTAVFAGAAITLGAWRLAVMLTREAGPLDVFVRLRGLTSEFGPLHCLHCTSVWTAAACMVLWEAAPAVVLILAISQAIILLDDLVETERETTV